MAGTSPDRSQRYESSTESTPGNEPPIRDTPGPAKPSPDPRLAMSRDPAPKPDQATAVFSRRALLEAAETEGSTRDEDEAGADLGAGAGAGAGAVKSAGRGAAGPEADGSKTGRGAGGSAEAGSEAGSSDADTGDASTDADSGDAEGSDGAVKGLDGSAEAPADADETEGGQGADGASGGKPGAGAEDDEEASGREPAAGADESGRGADETEAADAAPAAGADAGEDDADPRERDAAAPTRAASAVRLPTARAGEETSPEVATETDTDAEAGTDAEAEAEAAIETETEGGAEAGAKTGAAPEAPQADGDPKTTTLRAPAVTALSKSEGGSAAGSAAEAWSGSEGESAAGSAADVRPSPEGEAAPGSVGGARPGVAAAADQRSADVRPGAVGGTAGADVGSASDGDEPDAADGGRAPQGPLAGDEESRAGDAGGKSEGEGGAEAGRAVDQPTAIFRAPRLPAMDHPTTMLKLGAAATEATDQPEDAVRSKDADSTDAAGKAKVDAKPEGADRDKTDAKPATADDAKPATADDAKPATADDAKPATADDAMADAKPGTVDKAVADANPGIVDLSPPSERTSKFIALKPLDEHAPPKPPAAAPDSPAITPAEATRAIPQVGPERTTQQPLPPKPPLDLLAELTNTPPPRQTPVRTIIRRVKIWTPLAILLVIVFAVAQSVRPLPTSTLALTADESYAFKGGKVSLPWPTDGQGWMDVNGIGTMDSFGEQKPVAIGSVAKAMTAYVILKEHPMKVGEKGATIPVDAKAETEGGYDKDGKGESTLNTVKEGDKLSQYDAIAAIMIPSANNIARLLARWDSNGSEEEFVKKMNAAAKDLGMKKTTYTDPSGLKETTVSTAEDQVKLGNALVRMKALTDITKLPYWFDPSGKRWDNYNRLVPYDNAIGIKTGSTSAAGGNLLFAATKEVGGETAIVVGAVLGQHTPPIIDTVNAVSKTAMLAAQDALTSDTILKKGEVVGYVDDRLGGRTPVVVTKNVSAVGWAGKTVKLELDPSATIPHEAKPGTEVGSLIVGNGTGDGVEVPVALQETLTEPGFLTKLTRVS